MTEPLSPKSLPPGLPEASQDLIAAEDDLSLAGPSTMQATENWVTINFNHNGKEYTVSLADSDRVFDLKEKLYALTDVPFARQKILGLVKGALPADEATISSLKLPEGKKFRLIGTPVGQEFKDLSDVDQPDVLNDLDIESIADPQALAAFINDIRNVRKIRDAISKLNVNIMNQPRPGKKLLVLDLDYTILDTKPLTSGALPPQECARPGLHQFLETIYPQYDIVIWSQTSWVWLETKLVELEMVGSDKNYKISFVMDKTSMFTVFSRRDGKEFQHSVKALKIIWSVFPQYGPANTVHVDDLSRNFALNPGEGIKIHAFKDCHTSRAAEDRELDRLAKYLVFIGTNVPDFRQIDHKHWRRLADQIPPNATPQPPAP